MPDIFYNFKKKTIPKATRTVAFLSMSALAGSNTEMPALWVSHLDNFGMLLVNEILNVGKFLAIFRAKRSAKNNGIAKLGLPVANAFSLRLE
jgi:hypothetical protein